MKEILDEEGLQLLESTIVAAKMLDYKITLYNNEFSLTKRGGYQFRMFLNSDGFIDLYVYDPWYKLEFKDEHVRHDHNRNALFKTIMEMM